MAKQPFENVVQHLFQIAAHAEFKSLTDQELLKRHVEQRDELAFGELVRRYKAMIWNVCWRVLWHHQDVEDAFQATIMTLVRRANTILGHAKIEGWLHSTAFKVASAAKRDRVRRHTYEERIAKMHQEKYERPECRWEMGEVLDKELIGIPEEYRSPLLLCYLEGLTWSEAAQRLGISLESLEWRLKEGRKRLKKRLSKYGVELGPTMMMAQPVPGVHVPQVPAGLVEKTLDMVRIWTLSNGAWETAGISPHVAALVKGAMGIWTLKVKILLGLLLTTLAVAGGGIATYSGWLYLQGEQRKEKKLDRDNKTPEEELSTDEKVPSRTDLYGDPLPPKALHRLGTVRFRLACCGDSLKVIAFTPDGRSLLTIGKFMCFWDVKTGKLWRRFDNESFSQAALSSDGKLVVGISTDPYVWETATGKLVRQLKAQGNHKGQWSCAFSPDSKALLARLSYDVEDVQTGRVLHREYKLGLYDIATGEQRWQQVGKKRDVHTEPITFSPDGTMIADGGADGICLHDARTGQSLRKLGHSRPVKDLYFSPDGRTLLALYERYEQIGPSVYLWDVTTGKDRWRLVDDKNAGYCSVAFSPDGAIVAISQFWADTISLVEAATGKTLRCCQRDRVNHWGNSLAFSPDGTILASSYGSYGCPGVIIRCWEVASGKILAPNQAFPGHEAAVDSVAFLPDGRSLVSGGCNQAVYMWDSRTSRQQRTLRQESRIQSLQSPWGFTPYTGPLTVAAASPDGKMIAGRRLEMAGREIYWPTLRASICLWDATTGRELRTLESLPRQNIDILAQMVFSPDSKFLAACLTPNAPPSRRGRVLLYDLATGTMVRTFAGVDPTFFPDGTHLLTRHDGVLDFWNIATGKKVGSVTLITGKQFYARLAITPDWQTLAFSTDKGLSLYSLYGDKPSTLRLGPPHPTDWSIQNARSLVMSPDGKLLAAAGGDPTVYVWETATGKERRRFTGHHGHIQSLSFSPDGRRLASGSEDTTILEWDLTGRLDEQGHMRPVRLSAKARAEAWELLASADAVQAHRVIWNLVAARSQTVAFLAKHLHPAVEKRVTAADLAQLIVDLDSDTYAARKKARQRLEALGEIAEPNLRKALEQQSISISLKMRRTVQLLLAAIEAKRALPPSGEAIRELRAIEILEHIGTPKARQLLMALSQSTPGIRLTREAQAALHRLQERVGRP